MEAPLARFLLPQGARERERARCVRSSYPEQRKSKLGIVSVLVQLTFGPRWPYESAEQKPKHCLI